jgi:hypothetical protein
MAGAWILRQPNHRPVEIAESTVNPFDAVVWDVIPDVYILSGVRGNDKYVHPLARFR